MYKLVNSYVPKIEVPVMKGKKGKKAKSVTKKKPKSVKKPKESLKEKMANKVKAKGDMTEEEAWKVNQKWEMTAFIKSQLLVEIVENACKYGESIKMSWQMQ